jgi:hypothetical protein
MERYSKWWMNRYRTPTEISEDTILVSEILQEKKYKIDKDNNEDPNNVLNGQGYIITDRN